MDSVPSIDPLQQGLQRERAAFLLGRYPNITEDETRELCEFYRLAPAIETAMILSDDRLVENSRAFQTEHAKTIRRGLEAPWVIAIYLGCFVLIMLAIAARA